MIAYIGQPLVLTVNNCAGIKDLSDVQSASIIFEHQECIDTANGYDLITHKSDNISAAIIDNKISIEHELTNRRVHMARLTLVHSDHESTIPFLVSLMPYGETITIPANATVERRVKQPKLINTISAEFADGEFNGRLYYRDNIVFIEYPDNLAAGERLLILTINGEAYPPIRHIIQ